MMNRFRLIVALVGGVLALLALAIGIAFNPKFQTWVVRRQLQQVEGATLTVGEVSAGMRRVAVKDLRYERDGRVLVLPAADVELSVPGALWSGRLEIRTLTARAWSLDLSRQGPERGKAPAPSAGASVEIPVAAGSAAQAFAGVFGRLRLPVDVSVDTLQLQGLVVLPAGRGTARLEVSGGGLGANREGKLDLTATAALHDPMVNGLDVRGTLLATMDTPRTFTQLAVKLDATATGPQLPGPVNLTAGATAARATSGETYSATIVTRERQLLAVRAELPRDASRLEGTWKLDVRNEDIAPFSLGQPLPVFSALGEGRFDTDAALASLHAAGRIDTAASRLEVLKPELAAIGPVKIAADFDLAERGANLAVERFEATITSTQPVATVRALQSFEFNPATREVRASDPERELVGVVLQAVPLSWGRPWLRGLDVTGGDLRGEFVVASRAGGVAVRSRSILAADRVSIRNPGTAWIRELDLGGNVTADYTRQGWQAEITQFAARSGAVAVVGLDARVGRLAGANQPLKATGRLTANLAPLLQQPFAPAGLTLAAGNGSADVVVSLGEKTEVQAKLALDGLVSGTGEKAMKLPSVSTEIRADLAADGQIALNAPLVLERGGRRSDLNLVGTLGPEKDGRRTLEAQLTSTQLVVDDARVLGLAWPGSAPPDTATGAPAVAPWAGLQGAVGLQLKKVIYSDAFEVTNVVGRLRLDAGAVTLEGIKLGLATGGAAEGTAALAFEAGRPAVYGLTAEVSVSDLQSAPLLRLLGGQGAASVEGVFDVRSRLTSSAADLDALAAGLNGEFTLTSRGGIFRGLPVNAATLAENTSKIAAWLASAGTALGLGGRRDYGDIANKSQAVAEVAKALSAVPYDQLSVNVTRDAALNLALREFSLIAPEIRLSGQGATQHKPGTSLLDDSLAMEFQLRARGRQAELLRYLGALESTPDDLGYALCTLPLKVSGSLGKPDTSELNGRLASLALEKGGVTEKASELFNRILGAGK